MDGQAAVAGRPLGAEAGAAGAADVAGVVDAVDVALLVAPVPGVALDAR